MSWEEGKKEGGSELRRLERWEDREVARSERWEGSEVVSWERWEGSEESR